MAKGSIDLVMEVEMQAKRVNHSKIETEVIIFYLINKKEEGKV